MRYVFGVPGDYNLALLDEIDDHPLLRWIGNANELNAAYMADGYARLGGFAALVTTYGVGELSAINGTAGSYAESVPVLHVVGAPTREIQRRGLPVHHSLLDGNHHHFLRAAQEVTCAAATLTEEMRVREIDWVVAAVLREKKPGYLAVPSDLVGLPHPGSVGPVPTTGSVRESAGDRLRDFSQAAARLLHDGEVAVLVDSLAARHGGRPEIDALLRKGRPAVTVTPSGKGVVDESLPEFVGVYNGAIPAPEVRHKVEQADVTIGVGLVEHDLNTGGFTTGIEASRLIGIQPSHATVGAQLFEGVTIHQALDELARLVPAAPDTVAPAADAARPVGLAAADASTLLSQDLLWNRLGRFFQPGDIIAADQGTAFYGLIGQRLPADAEVIAQPGWSSIGYSLPAVAGAQLAASPDRRAVLVIGDGAAQLTVQEIGTIAREGLAPVIVLVNNDGYTVERAINGWNAAYNDISRWDWQAVPGALGADAVTAQAPRTLGELDDALTRLSAHADRICFLEVIVGKHDLPQVLSDTAKAVAERNTRCEAPAQQNARLRCSSRAAPSPLSRRASPQPSPIVFSPLRRDCDRPPRRQRAPLPAPSGIRRRPGLHDRRRPRGGRHQLRPRPAGPQVRGLGVLGRRRTGHLALLVRPRTRPQPRRQRLLPEVRQLVDRHVVPVEPRRGHPGRRRTARGSAGTTFGPQRSRASRHRRRPVRLRRRRTDPGLARLRPPDRQPPPAQALPPPPATRLLHVRDDAAGPVAGLLPQEMRRE